MAQVICIDVRPTLLVLVFICIWFVGCEGNAALSSGYRLSNGQEFLILAPSKVRPLQVYEVHVTLFRLPYNDVTVRAVLSRQEEEYASGDVIFTTPGTKFLQLLVPESVIDGNHSLAVEGLVEGRNAVFRNTTQVRFESKYVSLFIQTDQPLYSPPQTVNFRIVGTDHLLKPVSGSMIIYLKDSSGIIVRRWLQKQLNFGMFEASFDLVYPVADGIWTILVEAFGHTYEKNFEVRLLWLKERIFYVNLTTPMIAFDTEWGIAGTLSGYHTFSRIPSWGNATIEVTLKDEGGSLLSGAIQKSISYFEREVPFEFTMNEMKSVWGKLSGRELHFKAWIYDWFHLNTQNGTSVTRVLKDGVKLRFLGKKLRTFKPHSPITVYIAVQRSDGTPYTGLHNRQVSVMRQHEGDGGKSVPEEKLIIPDDSLIKYTFYPGEGDKKIVLIATHPETGSTTQIVLYRYFSKSDRYLSISTQTFKPVTDEYMTLTVRTNFVVDAINYLIIAGGNIILGSTLQMSTRQKTFAIAVSRAMSPTAKLVAYCVVDREIIMDSLIFYAEDRRLVSGSMQVNLGKDFTRETVELIVRGSAGGFVGINGNDYEWYQRGAPSFLRKEQIIKELMSYTQPADLPYAHTWNLNDARWEDSIFFSAPTTGMDTLTTLETSGLIALSDMNITVKQEYTMCNLTLGYGLCPNGQCYELKKECDGTVDCLDGYDEINCEFVADSNGAISLMSTAFQGPQSDDDIWSLREPDIRYLHVTPRHLDSTLWMWKVSYVKPNGQVEIKLDAPEAPNPVALSSFILHPNIGLTLMGEPAQYNTARAFFITSEAPSVVCRGEQFGVRLGMFNLWDQDQEVLVMLHGSDLYRFVRVESYGQVSSYSPRLLAGDVQTMVSMRAGETRYLTIPVVPIVEELEATIVVTISAYSPMRHDLEELEITVIYDGVQNDDFIPYILDLVNQGSQMIPDFNTNIPERFVLPGQRDTLYIPGSGQAYMRIHGDMVTPGFFEPELSLFTNIEGGVAPYSADGYMFDYAYNLLNLQYLQTTNVLEEKDERSALEFMQNILPRVYAYMQDDGSMKMFRRDPYSCVWLTAYSLKYLHMTVTSQWSEEVYVPIETLNSMALWLTKQQDTSGAFYEPSNVYYNFNFFPLVNDTEGITRNWSVPVTAEVVIALSTGSRLTGEAKSRADEAVLKASNYLADKYSSLSDPLQLAMTAYALEVSRHSAKDNAFRMLKSFNRSGEYVYWSNTVIPPNVVNIINTVPIMEPRDDYENLEYSVMATSYALMLYLAHNQLAESVPIMKWLVTQHKSFNYWSSSQDTLMAIEALSEFAYRETNRDFYKLSIYLTGTAREWGEFELTLNKTNFADLYTYVMPRAFGEIRATAIGTGYAYLAMTAYQNMEKPYQVAEVAPAYPTYGMEITDLRFWGRNASHMEMTVCGSWLRTDLKEESGMTFLEVIIPTGYMVTRDAIEKLYHAGIPGLKRVQFAEPSLLIFYQTITTRPVCLTFQADRWIPVANMSIPHQIEFRNYAEEGISIASAWESYTLFHLHICQVCGSFQCPYCDFYNNSQRLSPTYSLLLILIAFSLILC